MKYPLPLGKGSRIAVTAFSSGVAEPFHPRLDRVLEDLKARGFEVIEGDCLRQDNQCVSASLEQRLEELMGFLTDDSIDAILPPWGGEFAMELLPLLDFDQIRQAKPKWIMGFSDISTLTSALTFRCDWATAHCSNLMQLNLAQTDELTSRTFEYLSMSQGSVFEQNASECFEGEGFSMVSEPDGTFQLTEKTQWKSLCDSRRIDMSGRLIGGCLDTLCWLLESDYLSLQTLKQRYPQDGVILYFENAELSPTTVVRVLLSMKMRKVFDHINGILIGRSAATDSDKRLTWLDAIKKVLGDLYIPILYDLDIGHIAPNLTLINGAYGEVSWVEGGGLIRQTLS